ncbi:MAG TPA: group I intron-associated PD-(D/E)XK endonuclease [Acidimicrobiia bacterium]|nr:group I intron-associated PD-(D/E)XK endonuclease [Acidimicrobiia bacterium]
MRHHTKDKGDIGLACVIADLIKHEIQIALPISEHLPFDLIAIHPNGTTLKVSVKYRVMRASGTVRVDSRSIWNDRNGTHHRPHRPGDYDVVAIYCPDTDECYYVLASELTPSGKTLRITGAANNQIAGVALARWYVDPDRLFSLA